MSHKPLVSTIIPTRDRCQRVQRALRSALAQSGVDFEVIVVDDGSRDATADVVRRIADARVRLVRHESPKGESGARNRGVAEARGNWIAFLDDDDLWAPDKLERQLGASLEAERGWAYAGDVAINDQLHILSGSPPPDPDEMLQCLGGHNSVPAGASNVIVRSDVLARAGPFDTNLKRTADWDMWIRLAAQGPPACVRKPLVAICTHQGNMSRNMGIMFGELETLACRYSIPVDRARHYRWAAWTALREGDRWAAVRYYSAAVKAGDVWSVGRAAVAMVMPPHARIAKVRGDGWTEEARQWLDQFARSHITA